MMIIKAKKSFSPGSFCKTVSLRYSLSFIFISLFNIAQLEARADIYRLEIKEASCSLCSLELVQKFSTIKGVQDVTIEPQTQTVILKLYGDMTLPEETIRQKVKEANLTLQSVKHEKSKK